MTELPKLQLEEFYLRDAADLVAARAKAHLIHKTQDIDAAGDEVEMAVRMSLTKRLPSRCYVTHGHLVDSDLQVTPQIDVMIADTLLSPILFRGNNGTEYLPIESAYALGEVKSTYYRSRQPILEFSKSIAKIKTNFRREEVPPTYLQRGGRGVDVEFIRQSDKKFQNPLLSFMLFVDSGDIDVDDLREIFQSQPVSHLPSICCFLDKGVVIFGGLTDKGFGFIKCPDAELELPSNFEWAFMPYGEQRGFGANYGFLCYSLIAHVQESVLIQPDLQLYMN